MRGEGAAAAAAAAAATTPACYHAARATTSTTTSTTTPLLPTNSPRPAPVRYLELIDSLNKDLAIITGFAAVSTQPNAGATGEYAGLLAIKKYHEANGDTERNVCIIPLSAHGTNPASAAMAGMKVVTVKTLEGGDVDMEDMKEKVGKNKDKLAAFMITYPSTFGVFEEGIIEMCDLIHDNGGQVYVEGALLPLPPPPPPLLRSYSYCPPPPPPTPH